VREWQPARCATLFGSPLFPPRAHSSSGEMNSKDAMPHTAPNAPVTLAT
jgi:hypothetical protein